MNWEDELRNLGAYEMALDLAREQGAKSAVRKVRSVFLKQCKANHPDLNRENPAQAEENMRRLNAMKDRLDREGPGGLAHYLEARIAEGPPVPRLLVVEDEQALRTELSSKLIEQGYQVQAAANGVQGMSLHFSFKPDLVITNIVMPLMDGVSMVRHLRNRRQDLKVIFISDFFEARPDSLKIAREIKQMNCRFLKKPVEFSRLLVLIQKTLGRQARQNAT